MDMHQLRALELEMEQLERFKNSQDKNKFWDDFEIGIAAQIGRYRRLSVTYHEYYTKK